MKQKGKLLNKVATKVFATICYGGLAGIGINCFLTPAHVYSSGVNGLAQLLSAVTGDYLHINTAISLWVLLINLPLVYISWKKLGHYFTMYTLLAVISASLFIHLIPSVQITTNPLLAAIFGGGLIGAGVGLCLRYGFSTGGTDIIALVVHKKTGQTVGQLGLVLNAFILVMAGFMYGWEMALYSLVAIFANTKMIDTFYIQQHKVTITIFTKVTDDVVGALLKHSVHGITITRDVYGGYTNEEMCSVVTVVSKYDLFFVKKIIMDADPKAFINIQQTAEIVGRFADVKTV